MVFLAGISPNIRSHTVYIYGSGQPYIYSTDAPVLAEQLQEKGTGFPD